MQINTPTVLKNLPEHHARLMTTVITIGGLHTGMMHVGKYLVRVGLRPSDNGQPPLLIFNGIGGNIELLEPLVAALGDVGIITFDIPGVGHSAIPSRPYRLREMARLTQQIVHALDYRRVDVLGVSWGGALAQEFARRHSEMCRRLILSATSTGFVMVPGKLRALIGMATPRRYVDRNYLYQNVGDIYGGIFRGRPDLAGDLLRHVRWQSRWGYYLQLLAIAGWTSVHWLHRIKQPALVMSGDDDPITRPINARLQASLLPQSEFWCIDCGHLFLLTRADESAKAIRKFLLKH